MFEELKTVIARRRSRRSNPPSGFMRLPRPFYGLAMTLLTLLLFTAQASANQTVSGLITTLESKPQKGIELPEIDKGNVKGGFNYYILPDHELPLVKVAVFIKGGNIYDPEGLSGLSSLMTALMRSGGTLERKPEDVDEKLDFLASQVTLESKEEYITATLQTRSENFQESFQLFLEILFEPRFDKSRFEILKGQFLNSIKRRPDDPKLLASTAFTSLLYGKDSAWGAYPTTVSIESIYPEKVAEFHKKIFLPERMTVAVSGDVKTGAVLDMLERYRGFSIGNKAEILTPKGVAEAKAGVYLIDKETSQFIVNAGHEGSSRDDPDKYALVVMNEILGGSSFTRVLPALIRVEKGLAYTVGSKYSFGPIGTKGLFGIFLSTKRESAVEAISLLEDALIKFADGLMITKEMLGSSKDSILRALVFESGSSFAIVSNVAKYHYFGYPDNYMELFAKGIEKVTLDDIQRVAKKYLHPDKLQIVMVGPQKVLSGTGGKDFSYSVITIEN